MRQMDEMEMSINLKAIRYAWIYSILFLNIWILYDYLKFNIFNSLLFILFTSQFLIYHAINQFLKWKLCKDL
jgi:hypothetical protein